MPNEQMNEQQVAAYLHVDLRELQKLASRGLIPCRRTTRGHVFRKIEVDHWVEEQMHKLPRRRLAGIEKGVRRHHGFEEGTQVISTMIPEGGIEVPLRARTRDAVLRE